MDQKQNVFAPGDTLSGQVVVDLNREMRVKSISLSFRGVSETHWVTTSGKDKNTEDIARLEQKFCCEDQLLWGLGKYEGGEVPMLTSGFHSFKFEFKFPLNCPHSFEGRHGFNRYFIRARLHRPWKYDHNAELSLPLENCLDVSHDDSPLEIQETKPFGLSQIEHSLTLRKSGFVPGEKILVYAVVKNLGDVEIKEISLKLIRDVYYRGTGYAIRSLGGVTESDMVDKVSFEGGPAKGEERDLNLSLQIPLNSPPTVNNCKLIHVGYYVSIETQSTSPIFSVETSLPIVIGANLDSGAEK